MQMIQQSKPWQETVLRQPHYEMTIENWSIYSVPEEREVEGKLDAGSAKSDEKI